MFRFSVTSGITLALLFAVLCGSGGMASEYHVSPAGNDTAAGTNGNPFRTISHAARLLQPGDTCVIHAGV